MNNNRRVKAMLKIWHEEMKFHIERIEARGKGSDIYEVDLEFTLRDGGQVEFEKCWGEVKTKAHRQGFYPIPVTEQNADGYATILLVKRESVYGMYKRYESFLEALRTSYWGIQGDPDLYSLISHTIRLKTGIQKIHQDIKRMKPHQSLAQYWIPGWTLDKWDKYKERASNWIELVESCGLVPEDLQSVAFEMMSDLDLSHQQASKNHVNTGGI